jgi:two-component system sensor histidine kinase KdpD
VSILRKVDDDRWELEAASGMSPPRDPTKATLALPLSNDVVLALNGINMQAEHREQLMGFATQLAVAVRNRQLQSDAAQTAALTKANELRTALLAAVSHDLRTPLASIRASATSLLAEEVDWEPQTTRELLRTIDDEASRLNTLVGNLLDMSRLQTGAFTITRKPTGLEEVVAAALVGLHADPDRVCVDVPETLPQLAVDAALLERAVANLIDNALSFSSSESPVRVSGEVVGDHVHLRVIDHGPGIAPGDRARVFQPFQRLGDKPNGEGVGLGLAVAHGFVEAIGGEITVEDTPGGGCTMVVSLPLANGT